MAAASPAPAPPATRPTGPRPGPVRAKISAPWWKVFFGLDARSLALFRFVIGCVVIGDLIDRATHLADHFTDDGVVPRSVSLELQTMFPVNPYMAAGNYWSVVILFLMHGLSAFCLAIGHHTRWMQIINWIFQNGIMERNIPICHGGDLLLRAMLFWTMFLPLGECWSVDAAMRQRSIHKRRQDFYVANGATVAVIGQLIFLYLFSFLHKTDPVWRVDYTATFYALKIDFFRRLPGDLLLHYPALVRALTFVTLWWECIGNAFYVMPFYTATFRLIGCFVFAGMHIGFGMSMNLGHFSWVGVACQLALLPGLFWDAVLGWMRTPERKYMRIYYSPASERHHLSARLLQSLFLVPGTEVAPALTASEDRSPGAEWIVVNYKGKALTGTAATREVVRRSPLLRPLHYLPNAMLSLLVAIVWELLPQLLSTPLLEPKPRKPRKTVFQIFRKILPRYTVNGIVLLILLHALFVNLHNTDILPDNFAVEHFSSVSDALGTMQQWRMFSPRPPESQWSLVLQANLTNRDYIELWREGGLYSWRATKVMFKPPTNVHKAMPNHRVYKLYEFMLTQPIGQEVMPHAFGDWICTRWNARHPRVPMHHLWLWKLEEVFSVDGPSRREEATMVWHRICNIDEVKFGLKPPPQMAQVPEKLPGEYDFDTDMNEAQVPEKMPGDYDFDREAEAKAAAQRAEEGGGEAIGAGLSLANLREEEDVEDGGGFKSVAPHYREQGEGVEQEQAQVAA